MDSTLAYSLLLLGCACRGSVPAPPPAEVDWGVICDHTVQYLHNSIPLIFTPISKLIDNGYTGVPDTVFSRLKKTSLETTYSKYIRKMAVLDVLRKVEADAIPFITLKGDSLAWRYPSQNDRISIDTDILIPPEYEDRILTLMADLGATIEPRVERYLHSRCFLPKAGLIEIHISLMDDIYSDSIFNKYNERTYDMLEKSVFPAADGGVLPCLSGNDEFIYVFIHFAKHFISAECTMRNITDILVLMATYKNILDWGHIMEYMRGLKMDMLLSAIAVMGVTRFGYSQEDLPELEECSPRLADEVLDSIAYGDNKKGETSTKRIFSLMRKRYQEQEHHSYAFYLLKWKIPRALRRFFPTAKNLCLQYPFTQKSLLLLPAAYFVNICKYIAFFFRRKQYSRILYFGDDTLLDGTTDERINLFKDLNML